MPGWLFLVGKYPNEEEFRLEIVTFVEKNHSNYCFLLFIATITVI